jgi:hypothetical protein
MGISCVQPSEREVGLRLDGQSQPLASPQLQSKRSFVVNIDRSSKRAKERESDSMFQEPRDAAERAGLTQAKIAAAGKLVEQALHRRGYEYYSNKELWVLAILVAYHSYQQRARGKKSGGAAKKEAERRRRLVSMFLRVVVDEKYRQKPKTSATVMKIIGLLDEWGYEAGETQVRRDIDAALKLWPLPSLES